MARIRTIKPEFWTDEKIVQLPYQARLLFIGLWNFADDEGYLWDEPSRIKLQILPADDIDPALLIDLLVTAGLLDSLVTEDGKRVLRIPNFNEHQRVSNPAKSKISPKSSRKLAIPAEVRRAVAKKYGCEPGGEKPVECYYCGHPGTIYWWKLRNGKPSFWVTFDLELDHVLAEHRGGESADNNIVLACRTCNRSKGYREFSEFVNINTESSRVLYPEGNIREGKGKEGMGGDIPGDSDFLIFQIATTHPKLTHLKDETEIPHALATAIIQAVQKDGDLVLAGTRNYRDAVNGWPEHERKFAMKPYDFFSTFEYRKDPREWAAKNGGVDVISQVLNRQDS